MSSLEEIKKKLSIDEMDKESRQQMFNKFVEKGGQVIKEEKKTVHSSKINRPRRVSTNTLIQARESELINSNQSSKTSVSSNSTGSIEKIKYPLSIFIKGFFQGYFSLSGHFNKKYILAVENEFQDILSGLNFVTSQILNLDNENKWKMADFINKNFSLSYELIMRIYDLYKINAIAQIQKYMKSTGHAQCSSILRNIHILYKELVILYPYWETNKDILWRALGFYEKLTGNHSILTKNKINKHLDKLFNYYLPFFHIILCYNLGDNVVFEISSMKDFAQITEEEDIGVYTSMLNIQKAEYIEEIKKEKEERLKKLQESVEQKEKEKIPVYIQKGLKFIDDVLSRKEQIIRTDKKAELFEPNEKMLLFYILFKEFDKHYSFILTTSQLKLITRLESGVRTDIRSELDEAFIRFNEINNFVNEYIDLMEEFRNVKIEFMDNPIQERIKISNLATKRANVLNELKARASHFFKIFSNTLQKLINDYKNEKLLLQNPEDLLSFPLNRDKNRFDNVQIIKAIAAAFSFTSAMHYYITFDEFSQRSLYIDENKENDEDKSGDESNN